MLVPVLFNNTSFELRCRPPVSALSTRIWGPPADSGLVAFRVDGERFEILEQTIRAKGDAGQNGLKNVVLR